MHVIPSSRVAKAHNNQNIITSIYAEDLLGYYTYTIHSEDSGRLLIVYGDNGSGKTTLLKLVYYLLSTESKQGHKSVLANTRFKTIAVTLSNETIISASRTTASKGSFIFSIKNDFNPELNQSTVLSARKDGNNLVISGDEGEKNPSYADVMVAMKKLRLSLYFLQDDRDLLTASARKSSTDAINSYDLLLNNPELYSSFAKKESGKKDRQKFLIEEAFLSLKEWIQVKVIKFANVGESNNQNIYLDLVKSISFNSNINSSDLKYENSADLLNQLERISLLNRDFSSIGLVANFDYNTLINIIKEVKQPEKLVLISNILTPFIEGSTAKLNALSEIYNTITLFIKNVNDYFYDKSMVYHLSEGFSVVHHNGDTVQMSELSSGEKHLLHLWINSIIAEDATIFIIDEPEISLNIKWQRRLLGSLLSYTKTRKIQFIIATHSIELLANNMDSVVKLVNESSIATK